ncbi:MAG: glycerol-3-phosphate 1-O-acyltransferase PlsY [Candidatus Melainabacteria bacterium]|nr:glycerol-3-phosphate 1-O-acyltransferase PlsY [Candidatus Melainabacteria bacterium]
MNIAYAAGIIILGYLLGAIPTGYWVVKVVKGVDIRQIGSGSTGATNVLRAAGKGAALFVLIVDIMKGFVPVYASQMLEGPVWSTLPFYYPQVIPVLVAIIAIVGHSKSIFLNFTGGKSAATTLGTLYGLNIMAASLTFGLWILIVLTTKIVSLASVVAAISCPVIMYLCGAPPAVLVFSLVAAVYVVLRHKTNIKRILEGTEAKLGDKAKAPPESASAAATEEKACNTNDSANANSRPSEE